MSVAAKEPSAVDLLTEDLIELKTAAKELPVRTSFSTVFRWQAKGLDGIKLETVRIGNRKFTSREAVARFLAATQK